MSVVISSWGHQLLSSLEWTMASWSASHIINGLSCADVTIDALISIIVSVVISSFRSGWGEAPVIISSSSQGNLSNGKSFSLANLSLPQHTLFLYSLVPERWKQGFKLFSVILGLKTILNISTILFCKKRWTSTTLYKFYGTHKFSQFKWMLLPACLQ